MNERDRAEGEPLTGQTRQACQAWQTWRRTVDEWLCEKIGSGGEPARGFVHADAAPRLLAEVSNEDILLDVKSFVGTERRSLARVIVYLVEIEERRIHLELACSRCSTFAREGSA